MITGAASGIGLAAAAPVRRHGPEPVLMADRRSRPTRRGRRRRSSRLRQVERGVRRRLATADDRCIGFMRPGLSEAFGDVAVLMNNAGVGGGGRPFENRDGWRECSDINLMGVIHGVQAFAPAMIDAGPARRLIVNTGSKQGITTAAGRHRLQRLQGRDESAHRGPAAQPCATSPGCQVTAHLLVPGFTFTGMTRRRAPKSRPAPGPPEQVVDFMLERIGARRLLHPLPGQRGHPRDGQRPHRVGGAAT